MIWILISRTLTIRRGLKRFAGEAGITTGGSAAAASVAENSVPMDHRTEVAEAAGVGGPGTATLVFQSLALG